MKFLNRIDQLIEEAKDVLKSKYVKDAGFSTASYVDDFKYEQWKIKVKNLLELVSGKESIYLNNFYEIDKLKYMTGDTYPKFNKQYALLNAFKDDYINGYLTSVKNMIEADVFDSELEQATELLKNKYKLASAVIAGVVLETSIRSLCINNNLPIGKLDKMNSDLAKAGIYNKLQQKRITALADIRNSAAHGKIEEFTDDDVKLMIRDVENFLSSYLIW